MWIRSNPSVKQATYYCSRCIKMCDYSSIISGATAEYLSILILVTPKLHYMNVEQFSGNVHITYHTKQVRGRKSPQGDQAACTAAGRRRSCNMWRHHSSDPQTLHWTCCPLGGGTRKERRRNRRELVSAISTHPHSSNKKGKEINSDLSIQCTVSQASKTCVHEVALQMLT